MEMMSDEQQISDVDADGLKNNKTLGLFSDTESLNGTLLLCSTLTNSLANCQSSLSSSHNKVFTFSTGQLFFVLPYCATPREL